MSASALARRRLWWLLAWAPLAIGLYVLLRLPGEPSVRFVLYRSAAAHFYLDHSLRRGERLDVAHEAARTVSFGAPGDVGLACPQAAGGEPEGFRVFNAGRWYFTGALTRVSQGELALGEPGDTPFCADFDGDGASDSGVFRAGTWSVAIKRGGGGADIHFVFGDAGDVPVVLNVKGSGNATDRRNVVYGVYRQGTWHMDLNGDGVVDSFHHFGGVPGDVPLLLPRWTSGREGGYSLAIFRAGTWYVRADPNAANTVSFGFGQAGDLPSILY